MFWCNYHEGYVAMEDCDGCYHSDECDYGYAKDPGEDGNCSFFRRDPEDGSVYCRQGYEKRCSHKVYKTVNGNVVMFCGLFGIPDAEMEADGG